MHRILIADDSTTIRKMVRATLQALDHTEFLEAGTGLEAIEQLALATVQLIVLDLNMPDMHGIDVLKFLRRHQQYRDLPVIILTTRGDDSSREMAVEAGATTYMTKPFVPQALAAVAQTLLLGPNSTTSSGLAR
jgi:two-component system, chemotaxis family, chemotaxis protein CheY